MQAFIKRFVSGESGVTAYCLIATALMLIGVGAWLVATAPRVVASTQINPLEMMANAKDLPLATAQDGSAAAAQSRTAVGASGKPSASGGTKHHKKMHMSSNSTHKHKQLEPFPQVSNN